MKYKEAVEAAIASDASEEQVTLARPPLMCNAICHAVLSAACYRSAKGPRRCTQRARREETQCREAAVALDAEDSHSKARPVAHLIAVKTLPCDALLFGHMINSGNLAAGTTTQSRTLPIKSS
jgi:hypothetical protein